MEKLEMVENFMKLLHGVERVKRLARRPNEKEWTNTAEHTFELAMLCWYIASTNKLELDLNKIFKYALAHDVIEVYAGDTPFHDEEMKKTKAARETAALERVEKEFPEFTDLIETIHEYEERSTPEARFVYAADKLIDPINHGMELTDSIWKDCNITLETVIKNKTHKIETSEHIMPYWKDLLKKLEAKKEFFFPD